MQWTQNGVEYELHWREDSPNTLSLTRTTYASQDSNMYGRLSSVITRVEDLAKPLALYALVTIPGVLLSLVDSWSILVYSMSSWIGWGYAIVCGRGIASGRLSVRTGAAQSPAGGRITLTRSIGSADNQQQWLHHFGEVSGAVWMTVSRCERMGYWESSRIGPCGWNVLMAGQGLSEFILSVFPHNNAQCFGYLASNFGEVLVAGGS